METVGKVRCIIKRPDEKYGHVTNISTTLKNLQKIVEGRIEHFQIGSRAIIICNEEGKLRGLEKNFIMARNGFLVDVFVGTVIVIGLDPEKADYCDLDMSFASWKKMLMDWGN